MTRFSVLSSRFSVLGSLVLTLAACGANMPSPAESSRAATATLAASATRVAVSETTTDTPANVTPSGAPSATVTAVAVIIPSATLVPSPQPTTLAVQPSVPTRQATPASSGQPPLVPSDETIPAEALPPGLLDRLKADLATRSGVAVDTIQLVSAELVTWSDGSLGCPQPGVAYIQIIIEGYRVILSADGTNYDYRTGRGDDFILVKGKKSGRLQCKRPLSSCYQVALKARSPRPTLYPPQRRDT
ncbi:hypothetical protein HC891_04135 [Candidatus Gracilibacteria bacterium]|nr:hypothetical protein [Candidatus Gracilibacteria bacterium]